MVGEDPTNAALAQAPRAPLPEEALRRDELLALGDRLVAGTWRTGLRAWFWGEGVCLLGLTHLARARGQGVPPEVLDWLTDRAPGATVDHVNHLAPGAVAALAAPQDERLHAAVTRLVGWYEQHAGRDEDGVLEHWPGAVWADTAFMSGVFLRRAAAHLDRPDLLTDLADQVLHHARVLQDERTGLFVHGSHRGEVVRCFWGRANAWCALAAVEVLEAHAQATADVRATLDDRVAAIRGSLHRQLLALAQRQPEHGVWSVLVDDHPEVAGILETSAAAGIGAAVLRAGAVMDLPEPVLACGRLAVRGALAHVDDDGVLTRTSAGTVLQLVPFGYSVIRDDRPQPWGQGLALHAVAAALDAAPDTAPATATASAGHRA